MAIKTSTFSGWRLSDKDAEAFEKQIKNLKPNSLAEAADSRGKEMVKDFFSQGYVALRGRRGN